MKDKINLSITIVAYLCAFFCIMKFIAFGIVGLSSLYVNGIYDETPYIRKELLWSMVNIIAGAVLSYHILKINRLVTAYLEGC